MTLIKASKTGKVLFKKTSISEDHLDPIFKWTGGKRREIKNFEKFFPKFVSKNEQYTYVEPFIGGGAVYWHLNNLKGKNVINDFDEQVVNFYKVFASGNSRFVSQLRQIAQITDHDALEKAYYEQRDKDKKGGLKNLSDTENAVRFFVVNQLAFSGMRRFNSDGEFNVPFGHYKKLNADIINSVEHKLLLDRTSIYQGDFESIMKDNDSKNTFQFLDPPYTRVFKKYSAGNSFGEAEHIRLADTIKNMKEASVMMIIDKSPFTEDLYKKMIVATYDLKYGVNIKNRFSTSVEHLIVCNY